MKEEPIFIDLAALAGVDHETLAAADRGDRQAQKVMLRNLLTGDASPEALTSKHWTHWMLRMVATGATQAISDVLGAIDEAARKGVISKSQQAALHALFEQHFGPGEVGRPTVDAVRAAFAKAKPELRVINLFLIADRLASGSNVGLQEVERAEKEANSAGAPGAAAFFRAVWAQMVFEEDAMTAFQAGLDALKQLSDIAADDSVYQVKTGQIATMLAQMARALNDNNTATMIMLMYADAVAAYQAAEK